MEGNLWGQTSLPLWCGRGEPVHPALGHSRALGTASAREQLTWSTRGQHLCPAVRRCPQTPPHHSPCEKPSLLELGRVAERVAPDENPPMPNQTLPRCLEDGFFPIKTSDPGRGTEPPACDPQEELLAWEVPGPGAWTQDAAGIYALSPRMGRPSLQTEPLPGRSSWCIWTPSALRGWQ